MAGCARGRTTCEPGSRNTDAASGGSEGLGGGSAGKREGDGSKQYPLSMMLALCYAGVCCPCAGSWPARRANSTTADVPPRGEPVFGTIKASIGLRQFLLRGLKVRIEWGLACLAYNMRRLWTLAAT